MTSRRARRSPGNCDKGSVPGCAQASKDWRDLPPAPVVHNPPMIWLCLDCGRNGTVSSRSLAHEAAHNHAKAKGHRRVRYKRGSQWRTS